VQREREIEGGIGKRREETKKKVEFFPAASLLPLFSLSSFFAPSSFPRSLLVLFFLLPHRAPATMGLTFTKLFARLFSKREMRILMVSGRNVAFCCRKEKRIENDR